MTIPAPVPSPSGAAARLARALADLPGRSPDPGICPFLRLETGEALVARAAAVDDGHRCVAGAAPYVPSPLQQQLVCLTAGHAACPRYTRGSAALVAAARQGGARVGLPGPIRLAALAVVVIFVGALAFGLLRGAGGTTGPTATPTQVAVASGTPTPSASVTPAPTPSPTPTPTFPPSPTPTPSPSRPAATPTPSGSGGSIAARWDGLPKCPSGQACYLYTVKSGDTFIGIATFFGTTKAGLLSLNPAITNPALIHKGEAIKVPAARLRTGAQGPAGARAPAASRASHAPRTPPPSGCSDSSRPTKPIGTHRTGGWRRRRTSVPGVPPPGEPVLTPGGQ